VAVGDGGAGREQLAQSRRALRRRSGVVDHPDPRRGDLDDPPLRQRGRELGVVRVAVDAEGGWSERLERPPDAERGDVAAVEEQVGADAELHATGRERPRAARQVRVGDDRDARQGRVTVEAW
jgi:hypothetical protein